MNDFHQIRSADDGGPEGVRRTVRMADKCCLQNFNMSFTPTRPVPLPVYVTNPAQLSNAMPVYVVNGAASEWVSPATFYAYTGGSEASPPSAASTVYSTIAQVGSIASNTGDLGTIATEITAINGDIAEIETDLTECAQLAGATFTGTVGIPTLVMNDGATGTNSVTEILSSTATLTGSLPDTAMLSAAAVKLLVQSGSGSFIPLSSLVTTLAGNLDTTVPSTKCVNTALTTAASNVASTYVPLAGGTMATNATLTIPGTNGTLTATHVGTSNLDMNVTATSILPSTGTLTGTLSDAALITAKATQALYIPLTALVTTLAGNLDTTVPSTKSVNTAVTALLPKSGGALTGAVTSSSTYQGTTFTASTSMVTPSLALTGTTQNLSYNSSNESIDISGTSGINGLSIGTTSGLSTDANKLILGSITNHTPQSCGQIEFGGNVDIISSANSTLRTWTLPTTIDNVSFVHTGNDAQPLTGPITMANTLTFPSGSGYINMTDSVGVYFQVGKLYSAADVGRAVTTTNQQIPTAAAVTAMISGSGGPYLPLAGGTLSGALNANAGIIVGSGSEIQTPEIAYNGGGSATYCVQTATQLSIAPNGGDLVINAANVKASGFYPASIYEQPYNATHNTNNIIQVMADDNTTVIGYIKKNSTTATTTQFTNMRTNNLLLLDSSSTYSASLYYGGAALSANQYWMIPTTTTTKTLASTTHTPELHAVTVSIGTSTTPFTVSNTAGGYWAKNTGSFGFVGTVFGNMTPITPGNLTLSFDPSVSINDGVLSGQVVNTQNSGQYSVQFCYTSTNTFTAYVSSTTGFNILPAGMGGQFLVMVSGGTLSATPISD